MLEKQKAKGLKVPALDNRPEPIADVLPAMDCILDLGLDCGWMECLEWCRYYDQDIEEIWGLIQGARIEFKKWHSTFNSRKSSRPTEAQSRKKSLK